MVNVMVPVLYVAQLSEGVGTGEALAVDDDAKLLLPQPLGEDNNVPADRRRSIGMLPLRRKQAFLHLYPAIVKSIESINSAIPG